MTKCPNGESIPDTRRGDHTAITRPSQHNIKWYTRGQGGSVARLFWPSGGKPRGSGRSPENRVERVHPARGPKARFPRRTAASSGPAGMPGRRAGTARAEAAAGAHRRSGWVPGLDRRRITIVSLQPHLFGPRPNTAVQRNVCYRPPELPLDAFLASRDPWDCQGWLNGLPSRHAERAGGAPKERVAAGRAGAAGVAGVTPGRPSDGGPGGPRPVGRSESRQAFGADSPVWVGTAAANIAAWREQDANELRA